METLPIEIIELILSACEAKTLAISIPRVSKLFKKLGNDYSNIWKAKCNQKHLDLSSKPADQSWKRYYFPDKLKLFPLFGFTLSKSTREELIKAPGASAGVSGTTAYVEINKHNFWLGNGGKFIMMYLTYTDTIPDDWAAQGISWSLSYTEWTQLLKKQIGNYQVTKVPQQGRFQNEDCFTAGITSIVKEGEGVDAFYYQISLNFNYMQGTESSPSTLYAVTIRTHHGMGSEYIDLYEKRECNDKPN